MCVCVRACVCVCVFVFVLCACVCVRVPYEYVYFVGSLIDTIHSFIPHWLDHKLMRVKLCYRTTTRMTRMTFSR